MAQMSKTLATIEVHAPIEFDMEAAKLTDLYTPEAYVYMKRLEFKNMLTRFFRRYVTERSGKIFPCVS